jgi:orotate phosphoribosyltransferase
MAKASVYTGLFETKALQVKEFITHGERSYSVDINRVLRDPELFDNITLFLENLIYTKTLVFDRICATSVSAIPYATNVATSLEKSICWITDNGNNRMEKGDIKGLKIEGGMEIDDNILLIETISSADFYLENVMTRIRRFGGNVAGLIIILNICEGEYVNLIAEKEPVITLINLFDIFNHMENNNLIELFYAEKVKFFCEKETKLNIKKLLSTEQQDKPGGYNTNL